MSHLSKKRLSEAQRATVRTNNIESGVVSITIAPASVSSCSNVPETPTATRRHSNFLESPAMLHVPGLNTVEPSRGITKQSKVTVACFLCDLFRKNYSDVKISPLVFIRLFTAPRVNARDTGVI